MFEIIYPRRGHANSTERMALGTGTFRSQCIRRPRNYAGDKAVTVAIVDSGFETQHDGLNQDTTAQYHIVTRTHRVFANQEINRHACGWPRYRRSL